MATIDKILRKSNFAAAMTALIAKLNSLFVRKETGKGLSTNDYTSAEKAKLAGVAAGANNYVLPAPTASTIGGVKAGNNVTISEDGTISAIQGKVDLSPYAKTADVNTALGKKADVATTLKGYGITDAKIANGVITLGTNTITPLTQHQSLAEYAKSADMNTALGKKADVATTLKGYGITDAKIAGGVITLGANTITPLTQHQSLAAYAKSADVENTYAKKADITTVYKYRGSVNTYADLPVNGNAVGDVYNVVAADASHGIKAGDNVVWNGNAWDNLSGVVDLSAYIKAADADKKYMQLNDFSLSTDEEITAIVNETIV